VVVVALAVGALFVVGPAPAADTTPPDITPTVVGTWGLNGWRISDTTVTWLVTETDPGSRVTETSGCDAKTVSVDTAGVTFTCTAKNNFNRQDERSVTIRLDKTPPAVAMVRRAPDANGWYNHALDITPTAVDSISGQGTCTAPIRYRGPNRAKVRFEATCTNGAGLRARRTLRFKYDDTPPRTRAVPGRPPDRYGWYSRAVRIRFAGKDAVSHLDRCSTRTYGRPNSARASVTGWCRDRAGNTRARTFTFKYSRPLLEPRRGMRVSSPPLLDWVDVRRARGYNAQLWHDGRKILSRWPTASRLRLDRSWRYQGRVYRLKRGESYTWYVWPRFKGGYGRMLGSSRFAFVRGPSRAIAGLS
jgi:hypothetical protein